MDLLQGLLRALSGALEGMDAAQLSTLGVLGAVGGVLSGLVRVGGGVVMVLGLGPGEICGGWLGMDADGIIDGAQPVWGLPFARLEDVLAFKPLLERPKDREHVRLIRGYLGAGHNATGVRYS
ncbi:hypothetical protein GBA65_00755 [Rubrobacter marinus]|uniref:Uncharacterized protein n=1 Tax=Rubrobacter marinus TaxID=2653852 RepID=A0A6G8PSD4_9ACTN|nr:hypothetical protein [Rubrobacter marinus]QIN77284.1 hypothetical protein GBA65_00755 [Rubrobacter marinus]